MKQKTDRITALYIRVSTDAQAEEGYSIEAQKEMLEGYCKSKQIANYCFYIDCGFSGSNIERPKLKKLINEIKEHKIKSVVVYKLDRLSRSQKDTLFLIEDVLNPNQTEFVSLNENLDTSTSIGRAMLGIMSAFAQLERETIKERTRMGMKKRVESGLWMGGGKIPYGFDYNKATGKLEPNNNAENVKKMYELYIDGYSPNFIASVLGIKYDQLVVQILRRKLNYGSIEYKDREYENCHKAIVDKAVYEKAMDEMERRKKTKAPVSNYLLTGLLHCGVCSAKLRYQKWGKYATKIVCYSQEKSKSYLIKSNNCTLPRFDAEEIESYVLDDIFNIKTERFKLDGTAKNNILLELKERYTKSCQALKRLYDLYSKSEDDILLETINDTKANINSLMQKIENEEKRGKSTNERQKLLKRMDSIKNVWNYISVREKQQFIRSIIERIILYADSIEIIYKL